MTKSVLHRFAVAVALLSVVFMFCYPLPVYGASSDIKDVLAARTKSVQVASTQAISATTSFNIISPDCACTVSKVSVVVHTTIATNDTDYWAITVTNKRNSKAIILAADANSTKATGGAALTGDAVRNLSLSATAADLDIAAGDVLEVTLTKAANGANLVEFTMRVDYRFSYSLAFGRGRFACGDSAMMDQRNVLAKAITTDVTVLLTANVLGPISLVNIHILPTVNMAEFYVDLLRAGGDPDTAADWYQYLANTDFDAVAKGVRQVAATGPHEVTANNGSWAHIEIGPAAGIRIRGKAASIGTIDISVGFGRT